MEFMKWTNVVDRLPPLGAGKVVVYTKGQEFDGRQFFTMEADELYQDDDGLSEVVPFARFVTHWALLGDPERCKCNGWGNLCDCHITEALNEGDGTYRP